MSSTDPVRGQLCSATADASALGPALGQPQRVDPMHSAIKLRYLRA